MRSDGSKSHYILVSLIFLVILGFIFVCIHFGVSPDRLIGAAFCHQISARSPEFDFPFCYRCCGLFSGIFFGCIGSILGKQPKHLFSKTKLLFFLFTFILFLTDIFNKSSLFDLKLYPESPHLRFLSAYPLGFFLGNFIMSILLMMMFSTEIEDHKRDNALKYAVFVIGIILSGMILFSHSFLLSVVFRALLCVGCLVFLMILYAIFTKCIAILLNRGIKRRTAFMSGVLFATAQVVIFGGLHLYLFSVFGFPS